MLAYGGGSIKKNGIYDEMVSLLKKVRKEVVEFFGIMPNPAYSRVQEGAALVREQQVDFILAVVGGGSVIDCCKVISAQAVLDRDIWELEYGKGRFLASGIPMGAVVTASGTGAEMNQGAVIPYEEKMWKGPIFGTGASFVFLDPTYCNHGQGLAVIQPVCCRHILEAAREKFTRFAKVVFDAETAEAGLDELEVLIQQCKLPTRMSELKSTVVITPEVLRKVADTSNLIKTGPRELTRDKIYEILCECL